MTETPGATLPPTTIVIPTLNEAAHIGPLIAQLLGPEQDPAIRELIVADGGSEDGTVEIVRGLAERDARIRLIDNPAQIQSAGVNAAVAAADPTSEAILRVDAHAGYPPDFAQATIATLARTGADSVVVRLVTTGRVGFQRAVAAALNSRVGSGGSAHRVGGASGFVDHGHHAAFRRAAFASLGGYDEGFVANEDAEFDARLRAAGGRIWFQEDIGIAYYPRSTPCALARQYWRYGLGRAQTFRRHREKLRLRQMAPPLLVLGLAGALVLAPVFLVFLAPPLLYLLALAIAGATFAWLGRDATLLATPLALAIVHLTWGGGFLAGLIRPSLAKPRRPAWAPPDRRGDDDSEQRA